MELSFNSFLFIEDATRDDEEATFLRKVKNHSSSDIPEHRTLHL